MKRALRILIAILLLTPVIVLAWLATTESGLRWAYQQAESYLPGELTMNKLEGRLIGPITLKGFEYQQDGAQIKAEQILFDWQPGALLFANIDINRLHIRALKIVLPKAEKTEQALTLPDIQLPWRMVLKNVVIDSFSVSQNEQSFGLQQIRLNATTLFSQVDIKELHINADSFSLNIKGELQLSRNYHHELETRWQAKLPSSVVIKGHGQLAGDIKTTRIKQHLDGPLQATLDAEVIELLDQINWQARMDVSRFDVSKLDASWPAVVGKLALDGKGSLTTATLSGTLDGDYPELGRPFDAGFNLKSSWRDSGLDVDQFDFHSGDAHFIARGRVSETLKLDWAITASNLAELYPGAEGQLQAKGLLSGPQDAPMIKTSFNGKALKLLDYEIASIEGAVAVDLFRWQQINIKLTAQALNIKGHALRSLDISADTHHLAAKTVSDTETAFIELRGEAQAKGWRGRIERADIQSRRFGDWQLKAPAAINISETMLVADVLCWHNKGEATFCTSIQRDNEAWQLYLKMRKLPLMLFSHWLPPDLKLEGVADATAELQFQAPDRLLGQAHIELPSGVVSYPLLEGEHDRWEYRSGTVVVALDKQGIKAKSEIAMSNGDRFHGWVSLPDAKLLALNRRQQPLQASAQLNIHDLGLIEAIVPEVHDLRGEAELNLTVAGTLAQPRLNGRAHFLNGAFRIPRLGLSINQFTLRGQTDSLEKLDFRLDARSGDGQLTIQGQTMLDKNAGWPTEITIKGDQFEVSRIPEAQVLASPDLQIKLHRRTIDIKGNLHIPYARLQPKDLTTAARVSRDSVIVGSAQTPEEKWLISTRVRLTLSERVNFYGFGFEGRFGGSLLLTDKPGQLTTATGELTIPEGRYRAYGQRLEVEHGRLLYTGGPLTNPGLDLRAVRHINSVTAGIKLRGSLNQPQIELFSIPAMGQTDALAYLLLGRPIEKASGEEGAMMAKAALALGLGGGDRLARTLGEQFGLDEMRVESSDRGDQASLVVGRYLSPRLYVSYGVGLIEAFNTLTVRYQITDKWQLKSETGEYQGADILYTIER